VRDFLRIYSDRLLATLGVVSGVLLAMGSALHWSDGTIEVVGSLTLVFLAWALLVPVIHGIQLEIEEKKRRESRRKRGLTVGDGSIHESRGKFGFERIFALEGLANEEAILHPRRNPPERTDEYPLEIHRTEDETYLVGFVSRKDRGQMDLDTADMTLWMHPNIRGNQLVEVPFRRVDVNRSRASGDGNRLDPFCLKLRLTKGSH